MSSRWADAPAPPSEAPENSPDSPAARPARGDAAKFGRRDAVAVALGVAVVAAAFVVPHLDLGIVTPLSHSPPQQRHAVAETAPIFGWWDAHVGWGSIAAVVIGIAAVLWGPGFAQRGSCRILKLVPWGTACAWGFSLGVVPRLGPASGGADAHAGDRGDVVRLGFLPGDERRLAARVRGAPGSPP